MGDVGSEDVSVEMLSCPINPSDVNTIQGVQHFYYFFNVVFDDYFCV